MTPLTVGLLGREGMYSVSSVYLAEQNKISVLRCTLTAVVVGVGPT